MIREEIKIHRSSNSMKCPDRNGNCTSKIIWNLKHMEKRSDENVDKIHMYLDVEIEFAVVSRREIHRGNAI